MDIIQYLLSVIQYLYQQNCWLINFICRYIPLKQWAFDDSHSPKYQKFKVDELPKVQIIQHEWDWRLLIPYFDRRYGVKIKPVSRRKECDISEDCSCPSCGVLTVARLSWRKKNGSISSFTSVSTQNAPTISTTLRKWTRPIWKKATEKINISFTISTVSSR